MPGGALDAVCEAVRSAVPDPVTENAEEERLKDGWRKAGMQNGQIAAALEDHRSNSRRATAESRRNAPGTAVMSTPLPPVHGRWLAVTLLGNDGALVPGQVADKLVGKSFGSFRAFREAFWQAVAGTPELATEFNLANLTLMRAGRAPYPPRSEQVVIQDTGQPSSRTWELHHDPAIHQGGPVYDLSTIRIVTPKQHDRLGR